MIGDRWHTFYTTTFRPTILAENYIAAVGWYGTDWSDGSYPKEMRIDLFEVGNGPKLLVTSTKVEEGLVVQSAKAHSYLPEPPPNKSGGTIKVFPIAFVSAVVNGGQHDHLLIWRFDPNTLRPVRMLDAIYGDASRLSEGLVFENSPANYVGKSDWPKGTKGIRTYLQRTWTFKVDSNRFDAGKWRLRKSR